MTQSISCSWGWMRQMMTPCPPFWPCHSTTGPRVSRHPTVWEQKTGKAWLQPLLRADLASGSAAQHNAVLANGSQPAYTLRCLYPGLEVYQARLKAQTSEIAGTENSCLGLR